jgi:RND family efflux transporter MFP subunit
MVALMPGQGGLVTVAQIDTVNVGLDVSETDLARVKPGQPVLFHIDAYPGRTFNGTVSEVGFAADPRVRVFRVKVAISNREHLLKPGMFARGEVTTATHDRALVIPRDAVVSESGQTAVFVVDAGKARARKITLGLMSGPMVEVLSGLTKGESVVVAGQSGLSDGAPVTVR